MDIKEKFYNKVMAMSRGIVVLDENASDLEQFLKSKNFRVLNVPKGVSDENIASDMLSGRVFITKNSKDFVRLGAELEIGIINCDNLFKKSPEELSKIISDAYTDFQISSHRGTGWMLTLKADGKHEFRNLI